MSPEIKLKLVSGGKFILADALGFESELFVPVIANNRIVLQNFVTSRRCCNQSFFKSGNLIEEHNLNHKHLSKSSIPKQAPLANSTPTKVTSSTDSYFAPISQRNILRDSTQINLPKEVTFKTLEKLNQPMISENIVKLAPATLTKSSKDACNLMHSFATPEIVRRAVVHNSNDTIPLPSYPQVTHLKIVPLHRTNTPNTPKNPAKVVRSKASFTNIKNISSPRVLRNLSNLSRFESPPSLRLTRDNNSIACGTPNQSFLNKIIKTPMTETKWRKCITPKRTYLRHSKGQKTPLKTVSLQPLQLAKNGKLVDSYQKPIKSNYQIIFKRRKLLIDKDLKITPRKFKNQLTNTEDLNRTKFDLPKSRRDFYQSHMTAFDLLTNSSFYPKIGRKLNKVFRKGCVNKRAATILKYKQLTSDLVFEKEYE